MTGLDRTSIEESLPFVDDSKIIRLNLTNNAEGYEETFS